MTEINSQYVRTALYYLQTGPNEEQRDMVVACLDDLRCRLDSEEEDDFDAVTADDSEYGSSSLAVVRREQEHFIVEFDYGADGNYTSWPTYRAARGEAQRLWNLGWAGRLVDHVAADEKTPAQAA